MAGALYYPQWSLNEPVALGEFLLYWDRLTFITPASEWQFRVSHPDTDVLRSLHEAHELYALAHKPNHEEKEQCHQLIRALFEAPGNEVAELQQVVGPECATIAREKFLDITIDFLQSRDVLMEYNDEACRADPRWAHLIMAVLAHCCSSDGLPAITTDKTQFTLQMRSLGSVLHADPNKADEAVDDRATAVSMLLARIPLPKAEGRDDRFLRQVLQARAEDEVTGHREKFRATIDKYCERLRQAQCEAEVNDLLREFDDAADRDSKVLVRELRRIGVGCLVSKDGAIALLLGMAAGNLAPGIGHVVGAILGWKTYRNARRGVLRNHWSSWLYRVQHGKYTYY